MDCPQWFPRAKIALVNGECFTNLIDTAHPLAICPQLPGESASDADGISPRHQNPLRRAALNCQLVAWRVDDLRPLPSYVKHGFSVPTWKIDALERVANRVFDDPIVVTQDGLIIDGYARWELAKRRGIATIPALVYQRTEDEALRDFLWKHQSFDGLNDFRRIELSGDLKASFEQKARFNQQTGGRDKGSTKLEPSERVDSRKERAKIAGVSEGNVSKVDYILDRACSSTKQAAREEEISINLGAKWSRQTETQQIENLRVLRIRRCLTQKVRNRVAEVAQLRGKNTEDPLTTADLLRLLERLSTMSPDLSKKFGPVTFGRVHAPGKGLYVTEELLQALQPEQEVLIT